MLTEQINFMIDADLKRRILRMAYLKNCSQAKVMREAIEEYLERRKEELEQPKRG